MLNFAKLKNVLHLDVFSSKSEQRGEKSQRLSNGQNDGQNVDLEALQAIPPDFYKDDYDATAYEFARLPDNPSASDVDAACEKRKRSLEVRDHGSCGSAQGQITCDCE